MAEYASTKDSGIEWIGAIPSTWKTHTLYQLVTQVKNKNSDLREDNLLSLSYGRIKRRDINSNGGLLPESFNGYNIIEDGDIVLRLTDLQNDHTSLRVGLATERGIITSAYTTLRPIKTETSKYLYYLLHSYDIKKGFYGMGSGVRQGLNYDEVKELRVILPSDKEQTAIVRYLDEQCAKIDSLVLDAKESIASFNKWKKSLIHETVTKGLNPCTDMFDSSITWIGQMPTTWELRAIKYSFNIKSGATPKSDIPEFWNGDIAWITPADYKTDDKYVSSGRKSLTEAGYKSCSTELVPVNSIIFSKRAPIGAVAITQNELCTNQGCLCCIKNTDCNVEFFYYAISAFTEQFNLFGSGTTFKEISASSFGNFLLPYPPLNIQNDIVDFLNYKCSKIMSLITEQQAVIEELELYRKSLIYEVVTGKRKVV